MSKKRKKHKQTIHVKVNHDDNEIFLAEYYVDQITDVESAEKGDGFCGYVPCNGMISRQLFNHKCSKDDEPHRIKVFVLWNL